MHKRYTGETHARFRMSAIMKTWHKWCDGCRAEAASVKGTAGITWSQ